MLAGSVALTTRLAHTRDGAVSVLLRGARTLRMKKCACLLVQLLRLLALGGVCCAFVLAPRTGLVTLPHSRSEYAISQPTSLCGVVHAVGVLLPIA